MKMSKKAAAPRRMKMARKGSGSSGESDAEDNANEFGAGFNQFSNEQKKPAAQKKGGLLDNLFGGFS